MASFIGTSLALLLAYVTKLAKAGAWTAVRRARSRLLSFKREMRHKRRLKWVREQKFHMTHLAHLANTADEYRLLHTDCWTHAMWNAFWGATRELWERGIREELHYPGSDVHVQLVSEHGLGLRVRGGTVKTVGTWNTTPQAICGAEAPETHRSTASAVSTITNTCPSTA